MTKRAAAMLGMLGIAVHDHAIVGKDASRAYITGDWSAVVDSSHRMLVHGRI